MAQILDQPLLFSQQEEEEKRKQLRKLAAMLMKQQQKQQQGGPQMPGGLNQMKSGMSETGSASSSGIPAGFLAAAPWVALGGAGAAYNVDQGIHDWDDVWNLQGGVKAAEHYGKKLDDKMGFGNTEHVSRSLANFSSGDIKNALKDAGKAIKKDPLIELLKRLF